MMQPFIVSAILRGPQQDVGRRHRAGRSEKSQDRKAPRAQGGRVEGIGNC